jgi:exonuclease III
MRQLYAQTSMRLVTQNVRGLTPEKLEMIIHIMKDRGIHAAALQEAWAAVPSGRDNDETDGFLIIWHGETVRPCNRGRLGIVIILSPVARLAWEARGELVRKDREGRVMTVDLALEGQRTLRLGSAYFPTTGASSDERQAFYDEMTRYSADGEPRANTADVEPQKEGFYSDPSDACWTARGA